MARIEVREGSKVLEKFDSDVDPSDEGECVALLRRRARDLRRPVDRLLLRATGTYPDKYPHDYRV